MNIVWTIIIGFIVGVLAKLFMPGRDGGGILMTIVLGVAGALLAGLIGRSLGWYVSGQGPGVIASIIGAMLILLIYRATRRRKHLPI